MSATVNNELISFIKASPTAFHAVDAISRMLDAEGFIRLSETEPWVIRPGLRYYCTRNLSSIIAVSAGTELSDPAFRIMASHSDSPRFKIKEKAELSVHGKYARLNTEGYGGMICSSWIDRPLSVAGRVMIKNDGQIESRLVRFDRDLALIPGVSIHLDPRQNEGHAYNRQVDMLPLIGDGSFSEGSLKELVAKELNVDPEAVLGSDLYLYNREQPSVWGSEDQFISAPCLDDLQSAFGSLRGFLNSLEEVGADSASSVPGSSAASKGISVFCCFDNEEVGSVTKQGAASTFLRDTLTRICRCLGINDEGFYRAAAQSFMISCDNAHAVHPNFPEKTDSSNCAYLNEGIVIKSHAGQKYTSDGAGIAVFSSLCRKAGIPVQYYSNRSDIPGGSTLGNLVMPQLSMNCLDIGLPQLSMHSSYETAGAKDTEYLIRASEAFYRSGIRMTADGVFTADHGF